MSMQDIADLYHISRNKISREFKKYGLESKPFTLTNRKWFYNEKYFETIDSQEKAYWLGFIYADGCVRKGKHFNTLSIGISRKDEELLIAFKQAIQLNSPTVYEDKGTCGIAKITINSGKMISDLIKLGCVPLKTYDVHFPDEKALPNKYRRHFLRGFFDGDGCISYSTDQHGYYHIKVSIVGIKSFLESISNILIEDNILKYPPGIYKSSASFTYSLDISGKNNVEKIFNYFYNDANIYLKRKNDKFIEISNLNCNGDYTRTKKFIHICEICGDQNSARYFIWHGDDKYKDLILCHKHMQQLKNNNRLLDDIPYQHRQILCCNNKMIFNSTRDAANWCGLKSHSGIVACLNGKKHTAGKDPNTGEKLKWVYIDDNNQEDNQYATINGFK